ncbi:hypothetical protein [Chlorogloeopsis sp. ULAP02]|uniref:hypothetical protein n=1 Tax=Chlorogloeopsis sp. ULAP02 TaxID=3107926 RepID=UPI00398A546E
MNGGSSREIGICGSFSRFCFKNQAVTRKQVSPPGMKKILSLQPQVTADATLREAPSPRH